jgi:hypothetical protein
MKLGDAAPDFSAETSEGRIASWQNGEDVIIAGSVSHDEAKQIFGNRDEPKPSIRIVPQPAMNGGIS